MALKIIFLLFNVKRGVLEILEPILPRFEDFI